MRKLNLKISLQILNSPSNVLYKNQVFNYKKLNLNLLLQNLQNKIIILWIYGNYNNY